MLSSVASPAVVPRSVMKFAVDPNQSPFPDLHDLVRLFYKQVEDLAQFEWEPDTLAVPQPYRELLAHNHHMTVTVESFYGCLVDVDVIDFRHEQGTYQRKILLKRQTDQAVVMFGIVRLHVRHLAAPVQSQIESREIPLGRVLIENNVLRRVELGRLWRVQPNTELQRHFKLEAPELTFGRTAVIHCDNQPAIELVEIVAPSQSAV